MKANAYNSRAKARAMTTATVNPTAARPVVVYDGDCAFCRAQVDKMQRRDDADRFEYLPRQREGIEDRFPQLRGGDFDKGMRLIEPGGDVHVGADAVYHIARRMPLWRRFAWLYRVPVIHALCRWGYALIARNRKRLARNCESGCEIR
jgi:predicted DCC family thiol-disulfide oxidoreductase YuxK